jgi:hypothetical protein
MNEGNTMNTPCPACLDKPAAVDGHAHLGVRTIGGTMLTFECRVCHTHWARSVVRGVFTWTAIDEQSGRKVGMGTVVPPRSDPFIEPEPSGA